MDDLKADSKSVGVDNNFIPLHINTFRQPDENHGLMVWLHLISRPLKLLSLMTSKCLTLMFPRQWQNGVKDGAISGVIIGALDAWQEGKAEATKQRNLTYQQPNGLGKINAPIL